MFQLPPLPRTLDAARRDLKSPRVEVRADAARDLGQQGKLADTDARIELLTAALADAAPLVRRRAVISLADLEARPALPAVLGLLADPDLGVRQMAVLAMGELSEEDDREVEGRLLGLTRAGDPAIRYQALAALGGLRKGEAESEILAAGADPDPEVRELAVRLAAEHLSPDGHLRPPAVQLLRALATDQAPLVALCAEIEGLAFGLDLGTSHVLELLAGRLRTREAADERRAIALCAERGVESALPILRRRAFGWLGFSLDPYRWVLRGALARLGDAHARRSIARAVRSRRWLTRTLAVEAAGLGRLVELRPQLLGLSGHAELVDQDVLDQALSLLSEA